MNKPVEAGSVVLYKDEEDNEIYPTIITHKIGNKNYKYYRVAQNGLGMIMDYVDEQLKIPAFNKNLKASYDSIDAILNEKKSAYKEEALSILFYYVGMADERDKTIYQLFQEKGYTPEKLLEKYNTLTPEIKQLFISLGFVNMFSHEQANSMLEDIKDEKELLYFVKSKNNRGNYFNNGSDKIIFDKVNEFVTDEKIKNFILFRLMIISEKFVNENTKIVLEKLNDFENLNEKNKKLFVERIAPILQGVKRANEIEKEGNKKISSIVKNLKNNESFIKFVSEHVEDFFENIIEDDREYNLGHYFSLDNFINKESLKGLIGKVPVNNMLKHKGLDSESIEHIAKNGLYQEKFEDGSDATELNLSAIASHTNTPSYILEKIVEKNRTYLSADSYGKWDVLSALSNPSIDLSYLSKKVKENIDEKVFVYAALKNPNCPKEIKELIRETHGDVVKYETSGYIMVYDFEKEENIPEDDIKKPKSNNNNKRN